jgi:predicted CopG family antitoxin
MKTIEVSEENYQRIKEYKDGLGYETYDETITMILNNIG